MVGGGQGVDNLIAGWMDMTKRGVSTSHFRLVLLLRFNLRCMIMREIVFIRIGTSDHDSHSRERFPTVNHGSQ